jgi:hypothetical protein
MHGPPRRLTVSAFVETLSAFMNMRTVSCRCHCAPSLISSLPSELRPMRVRDDVVASKRYARSEIKVGFEAAKDLQARDGLVRFGGDAVTSVGNVAAVFLTPNAISLDRDAGPDRRIADEASRSPRLGCEAWQQRKGHFLATTLRAGG